MGLSHACKGPRDARSIGEHPEEGNKVRNWHIDNPDYRQQCVKCELLVDKNSQKPLKALTAVKVDIGASPWDLPLALQRVVYEWFLGLFATIEQ